MTEEEAKKLKKTKENEIKGGGKIMAWTCMSYNGVGSIEFIEDSLDNIRYKRILKRNLKKNSERLIEGDFYFMQDNCRVHTEKSVLDWLCENDFKLLDWPPKSPDMNPIENLFSIIKDHLQKFEFSKKSDLKEKIKEIWYSIETDICNHLVDSMPDRIDELERNKGGHTSY